MAGQNRTSFDGMTHEQMLAWLDAADAGTVQAAADKLASAAKEIHSIADELRVRPQWVKWKGEGADSFREWAGKLANATVALGDYSQDSSKWLGHAAQAISTAKTSVPRDKNVDANIDAARSAHNDPDAQSILTKNMAARQQTADEMEKLGQAYALSSSQMAAARKPDLLKFPPPPVAIQDPDAGKLQSGSEDLAAGQGVSSGKASYSGAAPSPSAHATPVTSAGATSIHATSEAPPAPAVDDVGRVAPVVPDVPTHMNVDSVETLPLPAQAPPTGTPVGQVPPGPAVGGPASPGLVPPAYGITGTPRSAPRFTGAPVTGRPSSGPATGGSPARPVGPSTPGANGRPMPGTPSGQAGPNAGGSTGSASGRAPAQGGVSGGRPQQATGRPATGVPRGTVMGSEGSGGARGTTGARATGQPQGGVSGRPTATGPTSRGASAGRLSAGASGDKGVVGGRPSQQSRANRRAFTQGGSGLLRSQGVPGTTGEDHLGGGAGRGSATRSSSRPGARQDDQQGERPDYVTEDQATWQPDKDGHVPPVVGDETKNDER
ncbi:hypothetical protein GCM10010431_72040 [Streptomyces kunmingensis]